MKKVKILTLLIAGIFLTTPYIYGYFTYNESCSAFIPDQCSRGINKSLAISTGLGQLVIDGAGYLLQSNSDFQYFLKKVELSAAYGANYEELRSSLDKAIDNMTVANSLYYEIWQLSMTLEYDPGVLEKLKKFDYKGYQIKNGLNQTIYKAAANLLRKGDVRGSYQVFYQGTEKILIGLKGIKSTVDTNQIPAIASCWRLNQLYLELELYGQYAAEIFMNLD